MDQEKYFLTSHNYSDYVRDILKELSSDDSFADVTLVTDDKKQIKAHKNILSACSSFFKDILQINGNNIHSVIYLRGIQHPEIESILQYIYLGETQFKKERMNEFLMVAKNLDIREFRKNIEVQVEDYTDIKTEELTMKTEVIPTKEVDVDEGKHKAHNKIVSEDKTYKFECQQCDKAYKRKNHLKEHIQSFHEGVKYLCHQCDQEFTDQSSLRRHIQSVHKGVTYACDHCDYQATQQSNLTKHFQSVHTMYVHEVDGNSFKFECQQCEKVYKRKDHLRKHIKSAHEQ